MTERDDAPTTLRFTPIFHGFFEGSLMSENVPTRYLFGWLIAQSQRPGANGVVDVPKSHISRTLNMPLEQVEQGIHRLMEPDPESRCRDEDGRRIVPLDPGNPGRGWRVVAHRNYRDEVHNALAASRMAAKREREKRAEKNVPDVPDVPKRSHDTKRYDTKRKEEKNRASRVGYPSRSEIAAYNKSMTGADAEHYAEAFKARFGVELKKDPLL